MIPSHKKTVYEILGRNPVHPFPARMAPGIALDALGTDRGKLRVLDPMVGSGTVVAVARANGHRAFGVDVDPLAVMLSRVWTRTIQPRRVYDKAADVLDRARYQFRGITSGTAYPKNCDNETRAFVRYWFDDYARRQLTALAMVIARVHDDAVREVLWCCFSRLIITKQAGASLAMDLSHSRPHRVFHRAPVKPFSRFFGAVQTVVANCPRLGVGQVGPPSVLREGDARCLAFSDDTFDLILTSPPYLNAIDYMRCSKFSLVWMGYSVSRLRTIRGDSVGAEASSTDATADADVQDTLLRLRLRPALPERQRNLLTRYIRDMRVAMRESARVLRPGGRAVYVVGDTTVRGAFIQNSSVVRAAAEASGLELEDRRARALPANRRYLPPPKKRRREASLDSRMRREVVLAFRKPG